MNVPELLHPGSSASVGESILWDPRTSRLYWIDTKHRRLYSAGESQPAISVPLRHTPGFLCLTGSPEHVLFGSDAGFTSFDLEREEFSVLLAYPDSEDVHFTSGKTDPQGRLWAATRSQAGKHGEGCLYRINPDFSCEAILPDLDLPGGMCWSGDQSTFFLVDSAERAIHAFDYEDIHGRLFYRRVAVQTPEAWGHPGGMTIDSEDRLWVAHRKGSCVACYDPQTGEVVKRLVLPVPLVTDCCFGGKGMDTLFVATGSTSEDRYGTQSRQSSQAGSIFVWKGDCHGQKPSYFSYF